MNNALIGCDARLRVEEKSFQVVPKRKDPDSRQAGIIASVAPPTVLRDVLSEVVVKVVIINHVTVRTCFGFLILSSN